MSHVIASTKDKKATIIDDTCDIDTVINTLLQENELTVSRVLYTHMHADYLSGSVRVARKYGLEVAISGFENYTTEQVSSEQDPKCGRISTGQKFELGDGFYLEAYPHPRGYIR